MMLVLINPFSFCYAWLRGRLGFSIPCDIVHFILDFFQANLPFAGFLPQLLASCTVFSDNITS